MVGGRRKWTRQGSPVRADGLGHARSRSCHRPFMVWQASAKLRPLALEQVVWSITHRYAGTLDVLAEITLPGQPGPVPVSSEEMCPRKRGNSSPHIRRRLGACRRTPSACCWSPAAPRNRTAQGRRAIAASTVALSPCCLEAPPARDPPGGSAPRRGWPLSWLCAPAAEADLKVGAASLPLLISGTSLPGDCQPCSCVQCHDR